MKKLSKTQQKVLDDLKWQIDRARSMDLIKWSCVHLLYADDVESCLQVQNWPLYYYSSREDAIEQCTARVSRYAEKYREYYEELRAGIALTHCSGATLQALVKQGLIEILFDSTNSNRTIDTVKVLNY